jgi:hypothetical protein
MYLTQYHGKEIATLNEKRLKGKRIKSLELRSDSFDLIITRALKREQQSKAIMERLLHKFLKRVKTL